MKRIPCAPFIALLFFAMSGFAQPPSPSAAPRVHDPSTVVRDGELYFVFSTGRGIPILSSPDLKNWTRRGSVFEKLPDSVVRYAPGNNGTDAWAPDIVKVGDTFYLYYAVSKWGSFASAIGLATNTTLNPESPAYQWVDRGMVVHSDGTDNMNDIDPGVVMTAKGELWMCFGSYHGTIDLVQLDPKTGLRLKPDAAATVIARASEASDIMERDGWFYLFVNHGSCCKGADSKYHINVGRSRRITGPYEDRQGKPLTEAAGEPFLATDGDHIGPGHFGFLPGKGAPDRFSIHYEAVLGGKGSTLSIHTLQWSKDGWPIAGPEQ